MNEQQAAAVSMMNQQQQQQQQMINMNPNPNNQMKMMAQHQQMNQQQQPQVMSYLPKPTQKMSMTINTNKPHTPATPYMNLNAFVVGQSHSLFESSSHSQMIINPNLQQQPTLQPLMNRNYGAAGMWAPPPMEGQLNYQNLNLKKGFIPGKLQQHGNNKALGPRNNWKKGKNLSMMNKDGRRGKEKALLQSSNANVSGASGGGINIGTGGSNTGGVGGGISIGGGGYKPPTLNELQHQNRMKARRFFGKKKYNYNNNQNMGVNSNNSGNNKSNRFAPYAPRNTTSFIIRAKKSGGIASLVSPCPVTPSVLPTPVFSPSREVLVDMAKEEWGVDGYGSMKGLIRLRNEAEAHEDDDDEGEGGGGSSESDVEEHVEVERRLDHDLSRFEMIYPNYATGVEGGNGGYHNVLENRVDDQDTHIAQLEEENLILKERLFLMEREVGDLRRRLQSLERRGGSGGEEIHDEVENDNVSDNESDSRGEEHSHSMEGDNDVEFIEDETEGVTAVKETGEVGVANDEVNTTENEAGKEDNHVTHEEAKKLGNNREADGVDEKSDNPIVQESECAALEGDEHMEEVPRADNQGVVQTHASADVDTRNE